MIKKVTEGICDLNLSKKHCRKDVTKKLWGCSRLVPTALVALPNKLCKNFSLE